ncbi:MAG: AAA family ATPase [Minisyncoccia bacterium]
MKFIMLNGSSCSGKSELLRKVLEKKDRYYKLAYDSQKWLFSKYTPDTHFQDVRKIQKALAECVCGMGYNIICDSALYRDNREELLDIPRKFGYEVIEINLEAEYPVLEKRFDQRMIDAVTNPRIRMSNRSKDRFKELYNIFQTEKNPEAMVIRTDTQSLEQAKEELFKFI